MSKTETEASAPSLRPPTGGLSVINLADAAASLKQSLAAADNRKGISLVKDGPLNVLLMTLRRDAELSEHRTRGPITVQVLAGAIRFSAHGEQITLGAGSMIALDRDVAHSLTALEDSSLLLTTAIA